MAEAGIKTPLKLAMTLPPAPYARQGGELVAAQLAKIGIQLKLQNVEWAQWLSGTYTNKNYDLTLISHVEPLIWATLPSPITTGATTPRSSMSCLKRSSTHRAPLTAPA